MAWSSVSALLGLPCVFLGRGQGPREVTRQQAKLLQVRSGQLELQRQQLDEQRQVNTRQAEVFGLQAADLRESPKSARGGLRPAMRPGVVLGSFPRDCGLDSADSGSIYTE